jgi:uncharacterized protein DUF5995
MRRPRAERPGRGGIARTAGRSALLGVAALFVVMGVASAEDPPPDLPWPYLLPPIGGDSRVQPHPVVRCPQASIECLDQLLRRLRVQWRRFDDRCDHRAVISFSYLKISKGLRDDLVRPKPGLVKHRRWMTYLITTFSNRYFAAFRNWAAGRPVPEGWRYVFETAARGDASAGQDVLLFSNVHVQHDLPFAYEEMGIRAANGASHKHDHDIVNLINNAVFNPIEDYIARHYDPFFETLELGPLPLEEVGTLEMIKLWREGAWRNGERLLAAQTPSERAGVVDSINATTRFWAQLISGGGLPGTRQARDQLCRST